jgi:predicted  nucleic acid-binding Zn-ribbon protein
MGSSPLRVSSDSSDYTLLGTQATDNSQNTRIVISGYDRTGANGNIEYICSNTGTHYFTGDVELTHIQVNGILYYSESIIGNYGWATKALSGEYGFYKNGTWLASIYDNGDILVDGNVGGATKSFIINHPDPNKDGKKLQHCCVETPSRGDTLQRFIVKTEKKKATIDLPEYYYYLNENIQVFIQSIDVFSASKYKIHVDEILKKVSVFIDVEKDGEYSILVLGTRKDTAAMNLDFKVEF